MCFSNQERVFVVLEFNSNMGGGVSIDSGLNADFGGRFYCHSCHHVFVKSSQEEDVCRNCQSSFIEEMREFRPSALVDRPIRPDLSVDQSRRIANATAILRLLELQLRQELEQLQATLETANSREGGNSNRRVLSPLMKANLKQISLNMEAYCSQPSCPICNEEFTMDKRVLRMPCSHIFHDNCVMPWLELKQNCPICRFELKNDLPSLEDLELSTDEELLEKFSELNIVIEDAQSKSRYVPHFVFVCK